jgi:thiamine transport system permease protein
VQTRLVRQQVVGVLPLLFLLTALIWPLSAAFGISFAQGAQGLIAVFSDDYTWRVLGFTTWQALLSTLLTVGLALPAAYVFAVYDFPGRRWLQAAAGVPFVLPTVVVALAFNALFGPRGLFGLLGLPVLPGEGLFPVLLAHVFYNYTVVLRLVGEAWARLDPRLAAAAALLGASRRQVLLHVTVPLLLPAIAAAAALVFLFCFTSFAVVLILGGPRMATLETAIYRATSQFLQLDTAAALALLQMLVTAALSAAAAWLARRSARPLDAQPRRLLQAPRTTAARLLVLLNVLVIVVLLVGPPLGLVLRSLLLPAEDGGWRLSFDAYRALTENRSGSAFYVPPWSALLVSLRTAVTAAAISLLIGVPAAYHIADARRSALLETFYSLPIGVSSVTLSLGYLVALSTPQLGGLRTHPLLIPLLHSLVALPLVIRALLPVLRARQPRLREAAALLGAPPWRSWLTVELPLLLPAIAVALIFALAVSLGEFGATLLLARPEAPTLPVMIFRFLSLPGALNYGQALAMSALLMLLTAGLFALIERLQASRG